MSSPRGDDPLREAFRQARRAGAIGPVAIDDVIAHSRLFVRALEGVSGRVIDLGSGGGVPGLVIAWDRPDLDLVLVDRRSKRTDLLRRCASALGRSNCVQVVTDDVANVPDGADAVVARLFASPGVTADAAVRLVRSDGVVVVSESPGGAAWETTALGEWRRRVIGPVDGGPRVVRFTHA